MRRVELEDGVHASSWFRSVGSVGGQVVGQVVGAAVGAGWVPGRARGAAPRPGPARTRSTSASTVRSTSLAPSSAVASDGRPVTPLVDSAGDGVAEHQVGRCGRDRRPRPCGRGARARGPAPASPRSRSGWRGGRRRRPPTRRRRSGSSVHQFTKPTWRSGRNRRRWSVPTASDAALPKWALTNSRRVRPDVAAHSAYWRTLWASCSGVSDRLPGQVHRVAVAAPDRDGRQHDGTAPIADPLAQRGGDDGVGAGRQVRAVLLDGAHRDEAHLAAAGQVGQVGPGAVEPAARGHGWQRTGPALPQRSPAWKSVCRRAEPNLTEFRRFLETPRRASADGAPHAPHAVGASLTGEAPPRFRTSVESGVETSITPSSDVADDDLVAHRPDARRDPGHRARPVRWHARTGRSSGRPRTGRDERRTLPHRRDRRRG